MRRVSEDEVVVLGAGKLLLHVVLVVDGQVGDRQCGVNHDNDRGGLHGTGRADCQCNANALYHSNQKFMLQKFDLELLFFIYRTFY